MRKYASYKFYIKIKQGISIIVVSVILSTLATYVFYTKNLKEIMELGINQREVYNSNFKNVDFSVELSKIDLGDNHYIYVSKTLENNTDNTNDNIDSSVYEKASSGSTYSNKLRSWGVLRKPNNETPQADPGAPELLKKYGGVYLGDTSKKIIYLTFDEGYENGYTPKILDVLKENKVQAAFFITGPYLKEHQDLVRRMVEEGHVVGNHTVNHHSLPSLSDKEIEEEVLGLERAFREKFGKSMKFLRPPKGEYSERTLAITSKLGYTNMFWSFAYDDWYTDKVRGPEYAYNMVMNNLHNGAILLLHAVSKDNADALDMIIKGAREKGYEFGTFDDFGS